jgi:CRISPR-associated protein Cmr1
MHAVTFTCEIITPMFIYGADGNTPELRPPSIKGALRFWWRALNGHLSLEELKKREGAIFGDTERRSKFNIRVSPTEFDNISYDGFDKTFYSYDGNKRRHNGKAFPTNAMYYLGYGVANWVKEEKKTRFIRPYIPPKTEFIVKINTKKEVLDTIVHTFKVLEQFGGLGSKSRNAFGCFKIKKYELNGIKRQLLQINPQDLLNNTMSDYTAFSKKVNFFISI